MSVDAVPVVPVPAAVPASLPLRLDGSVGASLLATRALAVAAALVLAACGQAPSPRSEVVKAPPPPARDVLAEVRASAADAGDVIEVAPLRDPAVEDLLRVASAAEQSTQWKEADAALLRALALTPDDPELLQRRAEVLLVQRALDEAERLAAQSYERGPKLGGLCRRNWTTVRIAREERGDPAGAATAAQQLQRCVIEPPVRM